MPPTQRPHLGALLLAAQFDVTTHANGRMAPLGLRPLRPERVQLLALVDAGVVRLPALAKAMNLPRQSVGSLVDSLEALGFVERHADSTLATVKRVRLGPVGRTWATAIRKAADKIEAQWASRLGKRELAALRELLEETRTRALTGSGGGGEGKTNGTRKGAAGRKPRASRR
jgi:DNA-binding MarR family transcriptional regulator